MANTAVVLAGVGAVVVGAAVLSGGGGGDDDLGPERRHEFPAAASVLPEPSEVGPEWRWPWDGAESGITEAEWRGRFTDDPRKTVGPMLSEFEAMCDEDYTAALQGLSALMGGLEDTDSSAGHFLTAGGEIPKAFAGAAKGTTREEAVAALRLVVEGTLDYAANDYSRSRPTGETGAFGPVTEDDSLNLALTVVSDRLLRQERATLDLSSETLAEAVRIQKETQRKMREAAEKEAEGVEERLARLSEIGQHDTEEFRYLVKELERLATLEVTVTGSAVAGADGGYLLCTETRHAHAHTVHIVGRLRRGNAVLEFSRTAEGPWAPDAASDMDRVLQDMVRRLTPFTR
jgi:hypothetical protein